MVNLGFELVGDLLLYDRLAVLEPLKAAINFTVNVGDHLCFSV